MDRELRVMTDHGEKATLQDVENDGDILLLADGRRLLVNPDDAAATSIWVYSAPAPLTLRWGNDRGAEFDLIVTNEETGDTITARLADRLP
jgi:hypothetical protein